MQKTIEGLVKSKAGRWEFMIEHYSKAPAPYKSINYKLGRHLQLLDGFQHSEKHIYCASLYTMLFPGLDKKKPENMVL